MTIVDFKVQITGDKENGFEAVLLKPDMMMNYEGEGEDELSAIRDLLDTIWIRLNRTETNKPPGVL